jgi:hypothetical protein
VQVLELIGLEQDAAKSAASLFILLTVLAF